MKHLPSIRQLIPLLIAVLLLITLLLTSCEPSPNVTVADRADKTVTAAFFTQYPVREWGSADTTHPDSHAFLITDEETFTALFDSLPDGLTVNFDTEMLAVYTYSAIYVREISVKELRETGDTLHITLRQKKPGLFVADACQPYQRVVAVKLDRSEVTNVTVEIED